MGWGRPVDLVHELSVHGSGGFERFGELAEFGLELGDRFSEAVVVGFEFGGAVFELVDQGAGEPASGDVGLGAEVAGQAVPQDCYFLAELAGLFAGVGEIGPEALLGDERAGRKTPGPLCAGLSLAIPGVADPSGELGVAVEERHRHVGPAGNGGEADRLAGLDHGLDGFGGAVSLGGAVALAGAAQGCAVVSHGRSPRAAPPEGDGDRLAGLAEGCGRLLHRVALVVGEAGEELFVGADVVDDDLELAGDVVDDPVGGADGQHGLFVASQLVGVGLEFGQERGV